MRCAWRDIATYIDPWWLPLFLGVWVSIVVSFFWSAGLLAAYGADPWRHTMWWTRAERRRFMRWLRDTGRGWVIIVQRTMFVAFIFAFVWPMVSPTFCENVKCKGYKGLKPRTECLPQDTSPKNALGPTG